MRDKNSVRERDLFARIFPANVSIGMDLDYVPVTEKGNDQALLRRELGPGGFGERRGISLSQFYRSQTEGFFVIVNPSHCNTSLCSVFNSKAERQGEIRYFSGRNLRSGRIDGLEQEDPLLLALHRKIIVINRCSSTPNPSFIF
jgi:hypothetical protein